MGEQIPCSCGRLNDPSRRYCGGCGTALGRGCSCGFPNSDTDQFCGGCGMATVAGPQITTAALRALDEPTEVGVDIEVARLDEMTVLSRPAPKTIENERALQFHEDTSTQRIEMMCDAVAADPNA